MDKILLVAAGLDPSGGAGFLADVGEARKREFLPQAVLTALTVQNERGVTSVEPVQHDFLTQQLDALDVKEVVDGVKMGLVPSVDVATVLKNTLEDFKGQVVWDPVLAPSKGSVTFTVDKPAEIAKVLSEVVTLLTPNAKEAETLSGVAIHSVEDMEKAAAVLMEQGFDSVFIKGGHVDGDTITDLLVTADGKKEFVSERIAGGTDVHGTGCVLATALACALLEGKSLEEACEEGRKAAAEKIAAGIEK